MQHPIMKHMKLADAGEKINNEKDTLCILSPHFLKKCHVHTLVAETLKPLSERLTF